MERMRCIRVSYHVRVDFNDKVSQQSLTLPRCNVQGFLLINISGKTLVFHYVVRNAMKIIFLLKIGVLIVFFKEELEKIYKLHIEVMII
jgi:hypothetical protein